MIKPPPHKFPLNSTHFAYNAINVFIQYLLSSLCCIALSCSHVFIMLSDVFDDVGRPLVNPRVHFAACVALREQNEKTREMTRRYKPKSRVILASGLRAIVNTE